MINEQTVKLKVASTSVEYARWGEITGNIESQTDLMNLLGERDLDDVQEAITQGLSDIDTAKEEAIEEISQQGGITEAVKQALLNCFAHVVWIDDQGQTYYDALEDALYPPANLVSISAVYTQGGTVYDNQTLDSLKSDLVVTAHWDNQTATTVTDYTLSGTLTEGTSTITVAYGGKITTFDVIVTHALIQYTITNNLTQCANSNLATVINELTSYSGTLSANSGYVMGTVSITMGGTDITSTAYDSSTNAISIASVTGNIVITAEAVEDIGWVSGVPYEIEWTPGYRINNTTGQNEESATYSVSDYLPCTGVSAVEYSNLYLNGNRDVYFYNSNQNYIYAFYGNRSVTPPDPVPRSARYMRVAKVTTNTASLTPYLYPTLTESTQWVANQKYVLSYSGDTSSGGTGSTESDFAFCYGATSMQTSLSARSFITFYDAEKNQVYQHIRQNDTLVITVPEGAYYFKIKPNQSTAVYDANTNNPWVYLY